jgi:hypothetical protein
MRWRTIKACPVYEVSDVGQVRRRLPGRGTFVGRVLTQCQTNGGYAYVMLSGYGRAMVHILVCRAFRGRRPSRRHEVSHRNGRCGDNRASNVRWRTHTQNERDKRRHGTIYQGARHWLTTLSPAKVRQIRRLFLRWTAPELAARFQMSISGIYKIVQGHRWGHVR